MYNRVEYLYPRFGLDSLLVSPRVLFCCSPRIHSASRWWEQLLRPTAQRDWPRPPDSSVQRWPSLRPRRLGLKPEPIPKGLTTSSFTYAQAVVVKLRWLILGPRPICSRGLNPGPFCLTLAPAYLSGTRLNGYLRSVFIISNREISNWVSQILKANTLLMCPYYLKFQTARVLAAKTNMTFWKLTVALQGNVITCRNCMSRTSLQNCWQESYYRYPWV